MITRIYLRNDLENMQFTERMHLPDWQNYPVQDIVATIPVLETTYADPLKSLINLFLKDYLGETEERHHGKKVQMLRIGSPLFRIYDFQEPAQFLEKFSKAADPISRYIKGKLDQELQLKIDAYKVGKPISEKLLYALAENLNEMLPSLDLYKNRNILENIKLSQYTQKILEEIHILLQKNKKRVKKTKIMRLNRFIFEDAYPEIIKRLQPLEVQLYNACPRTEACPLWESCSKENTQKTCLLEKRVIRNVFSRWREKINLIWRKTAYSN